MALSTNARVTLANTGPGGTVLGQARIFTVGDRHVEIGWHRSADFLGPTYMRRPDAYLKLATVGRNVEKGRHNMTPAALRRLAADLADYADILDVLQAAWDAEHADGTDAGADETELRAIYGDR